MQLKQFMQFKQFKRFNQFFYENSVNKQFYLVNWYVPVRVPQLDEHSPGGSGADW